MEIPYTVKARPDTGLWNAKIGIWLFLASEVMLFGGLFSSYIFLRLSPEGPWPVHMLTVKWGFINTLVLIFSSVTVLQAWLAVKMRKWNLFRVWMFLTIACAGAFMCIKAVEYNDKFHHYGVLLQDGSNLEGHFPHEGYHIKFGEVKSITLATRFTDRGLFGWNLFNNGSDGDFLKYAVDAKTEAKSDDGITFPLDKASVNKLVSEARKAKKPTVKLELLTPLKFNIPPGKIFGYDEKMATFRDSTIIEGKLEDDTMHLQVDKLDLRRLIPADEKDPARALAAVEKADAWRIMGKEWQDKFLAHHHKELEHFHKEHEGQKPMENGDFVREAFSMHVDLHEDAGDKHASHAKSGNPHKAEAKSSGTSPDHAAAEETEHHDHPEFAIEKKDIAFYSNFTPKYGNFFAIYFALTGLHGLHVIAGALVLTYFLLFGKKLFDKDPEHMANRVEVGGLFWHFVDLVWIFLFPLLYLM